MSTLKKNEFWRKKIQRSLEVLDQDKNGCISRADFDRIIQKYKELGSPESHLKKLRAIIEICLQAWGIADEKVKKTFEEAVDIYTCFIESAENRENHAKVFGMRFEQVDMDGDGLISLDEWVTHYKATGLDPKAAPAPFAAMDTNKDGKISKEEFVNYYTEYFFTAEDKLKSSILYGPLP